MLEMIKKAEIPEISKRIKQLRKAKGWSQQKLAKELKVTDGAVKMWETGKRFPRGASLKSLADVLGVSQSAILDNSVPVQKNEPNEETKGDLFHTAVTRLASLNEDQLRVIIAAIDVELSLSTPRKIRKN